MKQKITLGLFAFAIVAILGVGMVSAFGFGKGFMNPELNDEGRAQMNENMESMRNAIENNDYSNWKSLMEEQIAKMQEQITEDNFNKIVEQHQNMQEMRESCQEDEDSCPMFGERMGHIKQGMMRTHFKESSE